MVVGVVVAVGRCEAAFHRFHSLARRRLEEDRIPELSDDVKRRKVNHRWALVLSILRGDTSVQEAARRHASTVAQIEQWLDNFLLLQRTPFALGRGMNRV